MLALYQFLNSLIEKILLYTKWEIMNKNTFIRLLSLLTLRSFSLLRYCCNKRTSITQFIFKESTIIFC